MMPKKVQPSNRENKKILPENWILIFPAEKKWKTAGGNETDLKWVCVPFFPSSYTRAEPRWCIARLQFWKNIRKCVQSRFHNSLLPIFQFHFPSQKIKIPHHWNRVRHALRFFWVSALSLKPGRTLQYSQNPYQQIMTVLSAFFCTMNSPDRG